MNVQCSLGHRDEERDKIKSTFYTPAGQASSLDGSETNVLAHVYPILQLELLYNYISHTPPSLVQGPRPPPEDLVRISNRDVVELALKEPFLLNSLLAVSAMHLYFQNRDSQHLLHAALSLQTAALVQIKPILANPGQDRAIPALFFAAFTGIYAFAELYFSLQARSQDSPSNNDIERIVDCFKLAWGVRPVIAPHWEQIKNSWIKPVFHASDKAVQTVGTVNMGVLIPSYSQVYDLCNSVQDPDQAQLLIHAADRLFLHLAYFLLSKDHCGLPSPGNPSLGWPIEVQEGFLQLLISREPAALVLLAHYGALLHLSPHHWWTTGWPRFVLDAVRRELDESHQPLLAWPVEFLGRHRP
jgi:hypothetical protein